ncbi:MAG TPA: DUF2085 domain-containing protein [Vicinamibacterales bacterium]|nr:DUF2085 domain-containing protein [Vicinamibacterales bacterium]
MTLVLAIIFAIGGVVCHQKPERSFFIDAHQLPVCARCTGLYLGAAAGFLFWIGRKVAGGWRPRMVPPRSALATLAVAAVPTIVSVGSAMVGLWDGTNMTRAVLALPLGATAGAIVAAVAAKDLR